MRKLWMNALGFCMLIGALLVSGESRAQNSASLRCNASLAGVWEDYKQKPENKTEKIKDKRTETIGAVTSGVLPEISRQEGARFRSRAAKSVHCDTIRLTTTEWTLSEGFPLSLIVEGDGYAVIDWGDGNTTACPAEEDPYEFETYRHTYNYSGTYEITIYARQSDARIIGLSLWYYTGYPHSAGGMFSHIDVSAAHNLMYLYARRQAFSTLDVSKNTSLRTLCCQDNYYIEELALNCPETLRWLDCSNNRLRNLDLSGYGQLYWLEADTNRLETLKLDGCVSLQKIDCQNNELSGLNVSDCRYLDTLRCYNNAITKLNLSGLEELRYLNAYNNALTELNVKGCGNLHVLSASYNALSKLDISDCERLCWLYAAFNNLKTLDVSGFKNLSVVGVGYNVLTKLNISGCTNLRMLYAYGNRLKSLDVSDCSLLDTLQCSRNQLTKLDISQCTTLARFECEHNQLKSLDLSNCRNFLSLWARNNQLADIKLPLVSEREYVFFVLDSNPLNLSSIAGMWNTLQSYSSIYHFSSQLKSVSITTEKSLDLSKEMYLMGQASDYTVYDADGFELSPDLYTDQAGGTLGRFRFKKTGTYCIRFSHSRLLDNSYMELEDDVWWIKGSEDTYPIYVYYEIKVKNPAPVVPDEPEDPDTPTANEDGSSSAVNVYVRNHTIYLSENLGEMRVFTVTGQCIHRGNGQSAEMPCAGLYIVQAGGRVWKVVVK